MRRLLRFIVRMLVSVVVWAAPIWALYRNNYPVWQALLMVTIANFLIAFLVAWLQSRRKR